MDGPTWIGIGVLVGPALAVALSKLVPSRQSNNAEKPGESQACKNHEKRLDQQSDVIRELQVSQGKLEAVLPGMQDTLVRIEEKLS